MSLFQKAWATIKHDRQLQVLLALTIIIMFATLSLPYVNLYFASINK